MIVATLTPKTNAENSEIAKSRTIGSRGAMSGANDTWRKQGGTSAI